MLPAAGPSFNASGVPTVFLSAKLPVRVRYVRLSKGRKGEDALERDILRFPGRRRRGGGLARVLPREDSPDDISRGIFAGEVGSPRLLRLFEKYGLRTTWFIPGHSIETFPEQMKMLVDGGHEVGTHGYSHENPVSMTPQQERNVIDKCVGLVEDLTGKRPAGNSAPWWEPSDATNEILLEYGYKYDRSL